MHRGGRPPDLTRSATIARWTHPPCFLPDSGKWKRSVPGPAFTIMDASDARHRIQKSMTMQSLSVAGLTVHRLGYGTMRLVGEGAWGEPKSREQARSVLRAAVSGGINFIDTADAYGPE